MNNSSYASALPGPGAPPEARGMFAHSLAWIVLALSLAATVGGGLIVRKHEDYAARKQFEEEAGRAQTGLAERLTICQDVLHGAVGSWPGAARGKGAGRPLVDKTGGGC